MKEQFCDYETAKKLKGIGFNENCMAYYEPNLNGKIFLTQHEYKNLKKDKEYFSAPSWQQVEQYLFDKYQIYISSVKMDLSKCTQETGGWYCELQQLGGIKRETYIFDGVVICGYFNSPIESKTEGMKQSIIHLHKSKQ